MRIAKKLQIGGMARTLSLGQVFASRRSRELTVTTDCRAATFELELSSLAASC